MKQRFAFLILLLVFVLVTGLLSSCNNHPTEDIIVEILDSVTSGDNTTYYKVRNVEDSTVLIIRRYDMILLEQGDKIHIEK